MILHTNKVTHMKKALKTIGLLVCFFMGIIIATAYKILVALTGDVGYVIAVLAAALTVVSFLMLVIVGTKQISAKVVI